MAGPRGFSILGGLVKQHGPTVVKNFGKGVALGAGIKTASAFLEPDGDDLDRMAGTMSGAKDMYDLSRKGRGAIPGVVGGQVGGWMVDKIGITGLAKTYSPIPRMPKPPEIQQNLSHVPFTINDMSPEQTSEFVLREMRGQRELEKMKLQQLQTPNVTRDRT